MLSRFAVEVLSRGAAAALPQNLSDEWLARLQEQSDEFLDRNFSEFECRVPEDIAEELLVAAVMEIRRHQRGDDGRTVEMEEVVTLATVYALAVTMESARREGGIAIDPPGLDDVFDPGRIAAYRREHPEFVAFLEKTCILKTSGPGWFQNIKRKVLSAVLGN